MKKSILILLVVFGCLVLVAPAFAATIDPPTGTSIGTAAFIPSTGVTVDLKSEASVYCATAQHASATDSSKGAKQFGATSGDSTIKSKAAQSTGDPESCQSTSSLPSGMS